MRGFSLLEVLIAMAISSILLLGASRFLPALQFGIMQQMRQQALEDDLWQQLFTVAKHCEQYIITNLHTIFTPLSNYMLACILRQHCPYFT